MADVDTSKISKEEVALLLDALDAFEEKSKHFNYQDDTLRRSMKQLGNAMKNHAENCDDCEGQEHHIEILGIGKNLIGLSKKEEEEVKRQRQVDRERVTMLKAKFILLTQGRTADELFDYTPGQDNDKKMIDTGKAAMLNEIARQELKEYLAEHGMKAGQLQALWKNAAYISDPHVSVREIKHAITDALFNSTYPIDSIEQIILVQMCRADKAADENERLKKENDRLMKLLRYRSIDDEYRQI